MTKKTKGILLLIGLLVLACWQIYRSQPTALLKNPESCRVMCIEDERNETFINLQEEPDRIDTEKLLSILQKYERERKSCQYAPYFADEVKVELAILDKKENNWITILLGDFNVYIDSKGYKILEGEKLRDEVLQLIDESAGT